MQVSPFGIHIGDLEFGVRRPVHIETDADWSVDVSRLAGRVSADLGLNGHSGGVMVTGVAEAPFVHTCNRCLTEFEEVQSVAISQDFVVEDGNEYQVSDEVIDTEPLLRDELLLAIPLVPVCRQDCLGLCPECGSDLNTNACSGHEVETVSPFAELRSLFDQE